MDLRPTDPLHEDVPQQPRGQTETTALLGNDAVVVTTTYDENAPAYPNNNARSSRRNNSLMLFGIGVCVLGGIIALAVVYGVESQNNSPEALAGKVRLDPILDHLRVLYNISQSHGNSRSVMTGYNDSAAYILSQLQDTSYTVTLHHFTIDQSVDNSPPVLEVSVGSSQKIFVPGDDFATMHYSGNANIPSAPLAIIPEPFYGCDAGDWAGMSGKVVVIPRGNCTYYDKAVLAKQAGAVGLIYGNYESEWNAVLVRNVMDPNTTATVDLPMLGTSGKVFVELATLAALSPASNVTARLAVDARIEQVPSFNIIAEHPEGREDRVVVSGSHLDSVEAGPGINDNGSGSSVNLEIALTLDRAGTSPVNKLRFCWFGAEELGLLGSRAYVNTLKENRTELHRIVAMLNFDMLASPNYAREVYHGSAANSDGNNFGPTVAQGSGVIQRLFEGHFASKNMPFNLYPFDGRSDYGPFIENNISAGGIATGAEKLKTQDEVELFGGVAFTPYDPCYHQACDNFENVNQKALGEMSEAAAFGVFSLAMEDDIVGFLYNNDN